MRQQLLDLVSRGSWPLLEPLPVTRFLGGAFGVSNVSAYRVLSSLAAGGILWRAPNGRYFQAAARRLLERPAPVACLFRRLERWTEVSRMILQGADDACGELDRALLLVHDRALFRQTGPADPTLSGPDEELAGGLDDFLHLYGERTHGILLDELWPDRILSARKGQLRNGVVLYRSTDLHFLGCVSADFSKIAEMVFVHSLEKGFDRWVLVCPHPGYGPSDTTGAVLSSLAQKERVPLASELLQPPESFSLRLAGHLQKNERVLFVATEDNLAIAALQILRSLPQHAAGSAGLLSTMGTAIARDAGITCVATDFRKLGEIATSLAVEGRTDHVVVPPVFLPGSTT